MSQIVWAKSLVPGDDVVTTRYRSEHHGDVSEFGHIRRYPLETARIPLPDPRVTRSISRAAALMANLCLEAKSVLETALQEDPYSIGVYAAIENGPVDYGSVVSMKDGQPGTFAEKYRRLRNPKMYLKQLPNLAAAQMGIFLGIRGPMNVYTHSTLAGQQALEQADSDLEHGEVKLALVCTATGFEDPLSVMRACREAGERVLTEGASAIVLAPNGQRVQWPAVKAEPLYHGIGENIFQVTKQFLN